MQNKSNIDETKKIIINYLRYPNILKRDIEEHNAMLHELNKKIINIFKVSPIINVGKLNENGKLEIIKSKLDAPSHELLISIKENNEKMLRASFPNLYLYTDHLIENDGEINLY